MGVKQIDKNVKKSIINMVHKWKEWETNIK